MYVYLLFFFFFNAKHFILFFIYHSIFFFELQICYDRIKKQGCSILLHDGEIRSLAQMVAVSPAMSNTLKMIHKCLEKLHTTLLMKTKQKPETNLQILSDYFLKLSLSYSDYITDKCLQNF